MISLILVAVFIFFFLHSLTNLPSGIGLPGDGTGDGLIQPLFQSLMTEERIYPVPEVTVQNKKVEYLFNRHQDISQVKKIEARVSIPDGTQTDFPVVISPQKNLYYGIDDPIFGKEKRFIMTGYYQDDESIIFADIILPPR